MKQNIIFKSLLLTLALVLTFSSLLSFNVSANTNELNQESAVEILEALSNSSVEMQDKTILINKDLLEKELGQHQDYEEVKYELEEQNLLTNETNNTKIMTMAASNINPKWEQARDNCAKGKVANAVGWGAAEEVLQAFMAGNFIVALKKFSTGYTVPGLIILYASINTDCIKEANSKHNVYL